MFLIQYGAERVPKALSLRGGAGTLYWEPLFGVLVETADGWILFDTGMSRDALDAPDTQAAYRAAAVKMGAHNYDAPWHLYPAPPQPRRWNWGLDGHPLLEGLAQVGLGSSDISLAVISHLHVDHSGGIPLLARAGVPIAIHQQELAFARSGAAGLADGYYEPDWAEPSTRWHQLSGDTELGPGVRALATPGHTPGHLSLRVDLAKTGTWIFTADATDLGQNLLDAIPCGSCAGGTADDERAAEESLARLLREAAAVNARLVPGHDQVVLNAARHPDGGHR
jgi:glyoxylase-like metal-dependent hydrolase (beta-lactamase superfamily II)